MNKKIENIVSSLVDEDIEKLSEREANLAIERIISKIAPYDHEQESIAGACNINLDEAETAARLAMELAGDKKSKVSEIIENIEETYTKRELAYLLIMNEKASKLRLLSSLMGGLFDKDL